LLSCLIAVGNSLNSASYFTRRANEQRTSGSAQVGQEVELNLQGLILLILMQLCESLYNFEALTFTKTLVAQVILSRSAGHPHAYRLRRILQVLLQ